MNTKNIINKGFDRYPEHINRKGQPKDRKILTDLLRKELQHPAEITVKGFIIENKDNPKENYKIGDEVKIKIKTFNKTEIIKALVQSAIKGNPASLALIFDRIEGKVSQPLTGEPVKELPSQITIFELPNDHRNDDFFKSQKVFNGQ